MWGSNLMLPETPFILPILCILCILSHGCSTAAWDDVRSERMNGG